MYKTIAETAKADKCLNGTAAKNQRNFLLELLRKGPVTTLEARQHLIMAPAPRIKELKELGHNIITQKAKITTATCVSYIARYVLLTDEQEGN